MCTHERGLSIYMAENPEEFSKLNSRIDAERIDTETTAYAWGWKIAAHMTVRELLFPHGAESWDPTHLVDLATYITGTGLCAHPVLQSRPQKLKNGELLTTT